MFEGMTAQARQAIAAARQEAITAGQPAIGCEHLLLALVSDRPGTAGQAAAAAGLDSARLRELIAAGAGSAAGPVDAGPLDADALASLGIDLDTVRRAVEASFGAGALERGPRPGLPGRRPGHVRLAPELKDSLRHALTAAVRLRHRDIGSGHLLVGLIDQRDNAAVRLLAAAGADAAALRDDVLARLADAA
ncbi:MAG TPA: Clp protease N-terminal domain-containing protein [Streptosporangiaceae bacterium]|jgi:ATP-dependent Clp protease ATP-binding subunit ClpA